MRRLSTRAAGFDAKLAALTRYEATGDAGVERVVRRIIADVRKRGDAAVLAYARRFDRVKAGSVAKLEVPRSRLTAALKALPSRQATALRTAAHRIRRFHERQLSRSWKYSEADGTTLGQLVTPLERVGLYVPGGKAAYPSSVLMNAIPAKVAGVREVVMVSPNPDPLVLAAAAIAGVDRVLVIGGAQAVAALAYGTRTVPRVDKIVGPGNAFVAEAKRQVFGQVGIDMIAGPSEILVIGDGTTPADWVAMDLFSQAEHDELAQAILITPVKALVARVQEQIAKQLKTLERAKIARKSLSARGAIIVAKDIAECVALANQYAPEHLVIASNDADRIAKDVINAGAIFLGHYTPVAVGDYLAGPNHVLPTGGSARFFSPLGVDDFLKRMSVIRFEPPKLRELGLDVMRLAAMEGLTGHGRSVDLRLQKIRRARREREAAREAEFEL